MQIQSNSPPRLLVSIHDVMPDTLGQVTRILDVLDGKGVRDVTLLVVPGLDWRAADIERLRAFEAVGHVLAGHGWLHRVERIRGIVHRLHSLTISRNVAEHLALREDGIAALIERCHGWFAEHALATPTIYVPPAWAMGAISRERLAGLPFRYYEVLGGIFDGTRRRYHRVPVLGFEADAWERVPALRFWNVLNRLQSRRGGLLRVAIHPHDLDLRMSADLDRALARAPTMHYAEALAG